MPSYSGFHHFIKVFLIKIFTVFIILKINAQEINPAFTEARNTVQLAACNTSTFYIHLPAAAGQKINLKKLQTLPDGKFLIAGNITLANSEEEGFIALMTNSGSISLQKQVRINSKPVRLFGVKVLLSGKILIAGILHDVTDKIFVSLLNTDLSTNWLNIIDPPSLPVKITLDQVENDQIAVAAQLSSSIIYFVMDAAGSILWRKQISPAGLDELVGFGQLLYFELGLVTNCTRSGKKVAELIRIHQGTGATLSSHTIGNGSEEIKYSEAASFSANLITLGILKTAANEFKLVRDIQRTSASIETNHTYTVPGTIDFNTTCAMDNAADVLGFCFPQEGKLVFMRHYSYYQVAPEHTRRYNVPIGAGIADIARSFNDGGFLFGLNTVDSSKLILIKTDSIGILAGCSYETISHTFTETGNKQNTVSTITDNPISFATSGGMLSTSSSSLTTQTDCNQNYCPPALPDSCFSSYYKILRSNSYVDLIENYYLMRNNRQLVISRRVDRVLGNENRFSYGIKLFDERGNYVKGAKVFCDSVSSFILSRQMDDRRIMLIHYTVQNAIPSYTFTLIDDDLMILWSKSVSTFTGYNFFGWGPGMGDLVKDNEGNYYFVSNNLGFNETPKVLIYKMDASGNQGWLKVYEVPTGFFFNSAATSTPTSIVIVLEGDSQGSTSIRLDKTTGQLLNTYKYPNGGAGYGYDRLLRFENDRIFYAGNNGQSKFVMALFDTTGRPLKLKNFSHEGSIMRAATMKEGMLYAQYHFYNGSIQKDVLLKADSALSIQFINEYDILYYGFPKGMGVSEDGSIYSGGNYNSPGPMSIYIDPVLKKYINNGALGNCNHIPSNPVITETNLTITNPTFTPVARTFTPVTISIQFVPDTNGQHIGKLVCSSFYQCSSIDVTGPATITDTSQAYTYTAALNPGCTLRPEWIYDTSYMVLKSRTDTTANFKFRKNGSTWIKARVYTGCMYYSDSIQVQINSPVTGLIDLTADRLIRVFPNPTRDRIYINFQNLTDYYLGSVAVYTIDGKLLQEKTIESNTQDLDLGGYPCGIYLLKIVSRKNKLVIRKIVIY